MSLGLSFIKTNRLFFFFIYMKVKIKLVKLLGTFTFCLHRLFLLLFECIFFVCVDCVKI